MLVVFALYSCCVILQRSVRIASGLKLVSSLISGVVRKVSKIEIAVLVPQNISFD